VFLCRRIGETRLGMFSYATDRPSRYHPIASLQFPSWTLTKLAESLLLAAQ